LSGVRPALVVCQVGLNHALGLLLLVVVTAASVQEANSAEFLGPKLEGKFPRLKKILVDGAYKEKFIDWFTKRCKWIIEVAKRREDAIGFEVIPLRWIVERTFGWYNHFRGLSKDYEYHPEMSESMVYLASIRIMLKRLSVKKGDIQCDVNC
jgi:putative transposase